MCKVLFARILLLLVLHYALHCITLLCGCCVVACWPNLAFNYDFTWHLWLGGGEGAADANGGGGVEGWAFCGGGGGGGICLHMSPFPVCASVEVFSGIVNAVVPLCLMAQTVRVCKDASFLMGVVGATGVGTTAPKLEKTANIKTCVSDVHLSYNQLVLCPAPRTLRLCSDIVLCDAQIQQC